MLVTAGAPTLTCNKRENQFLSTSDTLPAHMSLFVIFLPQSFNEIGVCGLSIPDSRRWGVEYLTLPPLDLWAWFGDRCPPNPPFTGRNGPEPDPVLPPTQPTMSCTLYLSLTKQLQVYPADLDFVWNWRTANEKSHTFARELLSANWNRQLMKKSVF